MSRGDRVNVDLGKDCRSIDSAEEGKRKRARKGNGWARPEAGGVSMMENMAESKSPGMGWFHRITRESFVVSGWGRIPEKASRRDQIS